MTKKLIKYFLYGISILLVLVILEYARNGFIEDLSLQPIKIDSTPELNATQPVNRLPIYLISYASGEARIFQNQNAQTHYALNKGIDFFLNYKISHIDQKFYEKNRDILQEKEGGGLWLWKPYIIDKTLATIPEGAIVIYLDSAFKIKKPIQELIANLENNDIILTHDHDRENGGFVRGIVFDVLNCRNELCRHAPHIWSAVIVIRNTSNSRSFIRKWLDACQKPLVLTSSNINEVANYPEFKWYHYDQSVLSLIYFKNPTSIKLMEISDILQYLTWFHRKAGPSSPLKNWYTLYGIDPIINLHSTNKKLSSTTILNLFPVVFIRKWILETFF